MMCDKGSAIGIVAVTEVPYMRRRTECICSCKPDTISTQRGRCPRRSDPACISYHDGLAECIWTAIAAEICVLAYLIYARRSIPMTGACSTVDASVAEGPQMMHTDIGIN